MRIRAPSLNRHSGIHLEAPDYHKAMQQKDTVIIDVRNAYESDIGHFQPPAGGATDIIHQYDTTLHLLSCMFHLVLSVPLLQSMRILLTRRMIQLQSKLSVNLNIVHFALCVSKKDKAYSYINTRKATHAVE